MKHLILATVLFLMACATPEKPGQTVYQAESNLMVALTAELAYQDLPRCGKPTSPRLCSDLATLKKARQVNDVAWEAIQEAQAAVRTPGFAEDRKVALIAGANALSNTALQLANTLKTK